MKKTLSLTALKSFFFIAIFSLLFFIIHIQNINAAVEYRATYIDPFSGRYETIKSDTLAGCESEVSDLPAGSNATCNVYSTGTTSGTGSTGSTGSTGLPGLGSVDFGLGSFDLGGFDLGGFDLGGFDLGGLFGGSTGSTGSTGGSTGAFAGSTGSGGSSAAPCTTGVPSLVSSSNTDLGVSQGAGSWVPVRDITSQGLLKKLGEILNKIEGNTATIEGHVKQINFYLTRLCEKEFQYDKDLQHAWAEVIGKFVEQTRWYVTNGMNNNPLFLENQNIYYQLVDLSTARIFLQDIVVSNIGADTKRLIIEAITYGLLETKFPYDTDGTEETLSPDPLATDLAIDFYGAGSFTEIAELFFDSENNEMAFVGEVIQDFEARRARQLDYEREKLDWGRGFFSHEICDLEVYKRISDLELDRGVVDVIPPKEDRRNCRIATPGALIQDETSFVFGSALRQMELADEYEEWVAPNTLAVLSDILSYRTLNNVTASRSGAATSDSADNVTQTPTGAGNIEGALGGGGLNGTDSSSADYLPREFSVSVFDFYDVFNEGSTRFEDYLDPQGFIDQI